MTEQHLCRICKRPAVSTCTYEIHWRVCEFHEVVAAANGFLPKRRTDMAPRTPDWAAETIKALNGNHES